MSELDDLRRDNKELKRLLGNALELLEKSKRALTKQAQATAGTMSKKASAGASSKSAKKKTASKKSRKSPGNP